MKENWKERYYVCAKCDSAITITSKGEPKRFPMCSCTSTKTVLISEKEIA